MPNDEFTEDYYYTIATLIKLLQYQMDGCPLSVKLTSICSLLSLIYPETGLSKEEFLNVINSNVKLLMEK